MEAFLLEKAILKTGIAPVDLNTGANTGARVDMKNLKRCSFVAILAAGTTTTTHGFTLKQHDAASAGNSFDLSVDNPYFHKIGAATKFTKVEPSSAAAAYDLHALLSDSASIVVFEVLGEQLRSDCRWVSMDIADAGGSQLGVCVALGGTEFNPGYNEVV
jgi:hypothetical protein